MKLDERIGNSKEIGEGQRTSIGKQ